MECGNVKKKNKKNIYFNLLVEFDISNHALIVLT